MLLDDFKQISRLVAKSSPECGMNEENDFKAALLLIHDVLIAKEQERKSSVL